MLHDERLHLGQVDLLVNADRFARQIGHQHRRAAGASARTVLDHFIRRVADDAAVALVTRLGSAGL
jgi:hypothetical protein